MGELWEKTTAFVSHRRFASFSRAGQDSNNWNTPQAKKVKKNKIKSTVISGVNRFLLCFLSWEKSSKPQCCLPKKTTDAGLGWGPGYQLVGGLLCPLGATPPHLSPWSSLDGGGVRKNCGMHSLLGSKFSFSLRLPWWLRQ